MSAVENPVREKVARALFAVTNHGDDWAGKFPEMVRDHYRRLADAAMAALQPGTQGGRR